MEEYSDLKFDGDLSFLNDNLEEAKKVQKEEVKNESDSNNNFEKVSTQQPNVTMNNTNETNQSQPNVAASISEPTYAPAPKAEQNNVTINYPQMGEKKSQLEEIILNSGYGIEMFNNLKMELLELEKEKIIMKYKQDLMMMIIKS